MTILPLEGQVSDPDSGRQNSAYRRPVGWRWGGEGRKTLSSPDFPTGEEGIGMLTGARLERVRKAMQAVEDRVVGNNKRPSPPISRKGDKVIQKEIEQELKRLVSSQRA